MCLQYCIFVIPNSTYPIMLHLVILVVQCYCTCMVGSTAKVSIFSFPYK